MNGNRNVRKFLGLALSVLLLSMTPAAFAAVSGAIFTTNFDGSFVNANVYDQMTDVFLNGGPRPNAPCSAAGLPNGDYYFQVTDPSGSELLTDIGPNNGTITVTSGVITGYTPPVPPALDHATSIGQCGSFTVQLSPYTSTANPGNEYKVWMTPVNSYSPGAGSYGFLPKYSKTDNFKVLPPSCDNTEGGVC